jgi:hypothetical protein
MDEALNNVGDSPFAPVLESLLDDWPDDPAVHICPLCDEQIEDPLEECPTCAAALPHCQDDGDQDRVGDGVHDDRRP